MDINQISSERLVQMTSDDDSDDDLVTDYLTKDVNNYAIPTATVYNYPPKLPKPNLAAINNYPKVIVTKKSITKPITGHVKSDVNSSNKAVAVAPATLTISNSYNNNNSSFGNGKGVSLSNSLFINNHINTNNNQNCSFNMVPIISVTPHSPGAKYNNILEDTINQLQCIRESVIQMKNASVANHGFINTGLVSSKLFSSCPSLPDLTMAANSNVWPLHGRIGGLNNDRRKSWTGIEDLTDCTKTSHKSGSLSSLDSEEQDSIRTAERLHSRTNRNSTGGISTHSLNEAELARDFERIAAKRNLQPVICRIPLQKSISTPSIAPLHKQNAKDETSEKSEAYTDHPEKRRKRGSLFFRKKKDKTKVKGQSTNCDTCGAVINLATCKEHAVECKAKIAKKYYQAANVKSSSGKKNAANSHSSAHQDDGGRDYYDAHSQNDHSNYTDDTPLIRDEFLNETPVGPQDLGAEPILRVAMDECDSWSPSVPKEIVKSLKDKQVKRQEHIYEFIMTEKHHCQTLLVMQKVFVESLQRHFSNLNLERMFPRLLDLTEMHTAFLKKLRLKQRENPIVDSIADILLDFFSSMSAQKLKSAYGEFCSNHRSALNTFKVYMAEDQTFAEWYKHCQQNPLLKKKGIPECILFVTQRLTKYPLLIDPLLKSSREDKIEQEKLQKAMALVKEILVDVDARVAEKEKEDRQLEIFKKIDAKSCAIFKKNKFKKSDIISCNRKLKFEGIATLMQGRAKMQTVLVVVLSDCLFFLQENSQKYSFFTPENKTGVVSLQKLLIREKAGTESRGIYIISSNPLYPEMFELKVQSPKDKNTWIQSIRSAVLDCPSDESEAEDYMTAEQKQKLIDAKQANIREIICKMRQRDIEQAILLEEKIALQLSLLLDHQNNAEHVGPSAEAMLSNFGSYRDLINDDCDTIEIWRRVLTTVQEISCLAGNLYTAATGLPLARAISSAGERQSDMYISPTLPKRAETFGGFDERRNKQNANALPARDAVLSTLAAGYFTNRETHDKRDSNASEYDTNTLSFVNLSSVSLRSSNDTINNDLFKDHNYAALQVSHHLHTLLCIISQQMTTIQSLQHSLNTFRDNPKTMYRHNDQLEELRNLQDKLQEEKTAWQKQKEQQEHELEEQKQAQKALQEKIKAEQEDIRQQREQLYRKMEILSSQGLLLSPSVALPIPVTPATCGDEYGSSEDHHYSGDGSTGTLNDRRKDKWRTASINKTPPVNLVSATNAPKVNQASIKQQLPLKLSSLSSTKSNSNNNISLTSPQSNLNNMSGGMSQMFPLKLADKKNQQITPNHSRTGSSPAVIQQQIPFQYGNPATRTNTYPKIPERYRLRSSDGIQTPLHSTPPQIPHHQQRSASLHGHLPTTNLPLTMANSTNISGAAASPPAVPKRDNANNKKDQEEEVIYF